MRTTASRVSEILLLAFVAFSVLWRGGKSIDATWILVGVACVLVGLDWYRSKRKVPMTHGRVPMAVWISGFGFILWTFLSFLHSTTQNYGLDEVLRDGALFLVFCHVVRIPAEEREDRWTRFLMILSVTAAAAAILGIAVYALQPVNRFVGTFLDWRFHTDYWPNAWAEFVLLAWPAPLALLWSTPSPSDGEGGGEGHLRRWLLIAILGLLIGSLLLSYSRASWMVFGIQALLLLGCILYPQVGKPAAERMPGSSIARIFSYATTVGIIAVVLFFGANQLRSSSFPVQSVTEKVTFTSTEGTSSIDERSQFWRQALELGSQKPLLGWGPYSFRFTQTPLMEGVLQTSDHPHNVFLKLSMERGAPAALLFAAFIALIFMSVFRKDSPFTILHSPSASLGVFGVLLHNLVDYNLQFVGIVAPMWVMMGFLVAPSPHPPIRSGEGEGTLWVERILAGTLISVALIEGMFLITSSLGRRAEARGDFERALRWYERSSNEIFTRDMQLSRSNLLINNSDWQKGSEALDAYYISNNSDVRYWKIRGGLEQAQRQHEQARESYSEAYRRGRWTDIGILFSILTLERKIPGALTEAIYRDYESLVLAYGKAIERNDHFIALSPNVEAFLVTAKLLPVLCPLETDLCERSRASLELLSASADRNAAKERAMLEARPRGYLW